MDEEMEDSNEVEYTFTAVEIDLDYEYDAVRFFDFCREESIAEARQAELWFETAAAYPPSPFVARLITGLEHGLLENVNTSPKPKPKQEENGNLLESNDVDEIEIDDNTCAVDRDNEGKELNNGGISYHLPSSYGQKLLNQHQQLPPGLTFYDHISQDTSKANTKSSMKPHGARTSTLMQPTASQLAKQNQPRQMCSARFQKLLVGKIVGSNNSWKVEIQAPKRQKLEVGHLCKIGETKQQMNFVHKWTKRGATIDEDTMQSKARITIPREPDLETTYRAQRTRQTTGKETQTTSSTVRRFKALPLNRKILEAPSFLVQKRSVPRAPQFHEFRLKTSERAMQHTATVSMPIASCNISDKELNKCDRPSTAECRDEMRRCNVAGTAKEEGSQMSHNFKALPLNRKIFSSKGDIGVFRNNKREITVPKEFNFHTEKRAQHNPPIELFNKLSLASEPKQKLEHPRPSSLPAKGSKENRWDPFQQEHQVKHEVREKLHSNGGRQVSFGANGRKTDDDLVSGIGRSLGVR